jgi:hypothetical protein
LVLWRATIPDDEQEDDDEDGRLFQTVSVYAPGYYPEETLQYLRSRTVGY